MRRTILLLATIALALIVAGGMAWAAPGPPGVMNTVPADEATGLAPPLTSRRSSQRR
jgi:hypothetical protein